MGKGLALTVVVVTLVVSLAFGIDYCRYDIPKYGGTPCNELPFLDAGTPMPACSYYICDLNVNCSAAPAEKQKKLRSRRIWRQGADPYQYFQGSVISETSVPECCYCINGNGNPG